MAEKVPDPTSSNPDQRSRVNYVLHNVIPDFFRNIRVMMRNRNLSGVTGEFIDEAFPLPEGFDPFDVMIDTSRTGTVRIQKTSDLFHTLGMTWWHDRNVDLRQVFRTFSAIDPELESVVRREFQRLFTRRTIQKLIDPHTGREYLDR